MPLNTDLDLVILISFSDCTLVSVIRSHKQRCHLRHPKVPKTSTWMGLADKIGDEREDRCGVSRGISDHTGCLCKGQLDLSCGRLSFDLLWVFCTWYKRCLTIQACLSCLSLDMGHDWRDHWVSQTSAQGWQVGHRTYKKPALSEAAAGGQVGCPTAPKMRSHFSCMHLGNWIVPNICLHQRMLWTDFHLLLRVMRILVIETSFYSSVIRIVTLFFKLKVN